MIVKMNRITLLGMEYQRDELTKALMGLGIVEISSIDIEDYREIIGNPDVQTELQRIETELSQVDSSLSCLNKYSPVKKPMFAGRREVTVSDFNNIVKNSETVRNSVKQILEKEEHLINLKTEENKLNNLYLSLLPWKELDAPLEYKGSHKTVFQYGTLPSVIEWDLVQSELYEKVPDSYIEKINSDKDQHYLFLIVHKDSEQECLSYLASKGYNRVAFAGLTGTVADNIIKINKRIEEISSEREKTIEQIKNMSRNRNAIEVLYDWLLMEKGRLEATERIIKTNRVFQITGWVPERNALDVKKFLESKFIVSV